MAKTDILFPTGRMIGGSIYEGQTTDAEGRPLLYKSGDKTGQPRKNFSVGYAIPKAGEAHWNQTAWGAAIWQAGVAGFPHAANLPTFSWKVIDGDSAAVNTKGNAPRDQIGYPGHWVVWFNGAQPPRAYNRDGTAALTEPNAIIPGHFVQMYGSVDFNDSTQKPGVYMNHNMISLQGYHPDGIINTGPNAAAVGFGGGPAPANVLQVPNGAMTPPATTVTPPATAAGAASTAVAVPNPAMTAVPTPPPAVTPPAVTPPRQLDPAKAMGNTKEDLFKQGWTEELLVQHGMYL